MTLHEIIEEIKEMEREIRFPEDFYEAGKKDAYCAVLDFLTKAEAEKKDVGLAEEIELCKRDFEQVDVEWNQDFDFIARHFYELGKNEERYD